MAGSTSDDYGEGVRSSSAEGMLNEDHSGDSLVEWRSCEQVENGTPSTSPPYCDTDDEDDCGPKPSDLYGKFTWKIEKFSQISKRELRSNAFEVGGYKWYILIYPQGCDVCNHLSLFLCVANHDKLLPGWSHFAQFTIAVVNKDPKKSKYSDTLHRFWKKEHDWGWKKFMELSKVLDGFIVSDTLVIKAQVQVIREKAHRPFRCLDCQYRRELVRVYLSNVEQICRRFVEERRGKLSKLVDDKVRWSSFHAFWLGIDQNARRRMSRDKTDAILKVVVKHFFIEKEVTSTLVMDSLYSGLKSLECQSKTDKSRAKLVEMEESPAPMVRIENDMFVLADDVLPLLERAALEPLPHQPLPSKDDKGSQNRSKEGSSGEEFNKDSIERDERRLTELGRRTVEIFILAHIFSSKIEVAYQEAVALKRQEELIREEEAAGQAENELKAKRGATEKEKRTKKKQAKQKRSIRKGKDKGRNEKSDAMTLDKHQVESPSDERIMEDFSSEQALPVLENISTLEDISDVSDTADDVSKALQPDLEDTDTSHIDWDTDTSELLPAMEASNEAQNGQVEKKSPSTMDDSSSTCSTDSVPSVVMNGPYKGNSMPKNKSHTSPNRGQSQQSKDMSGQTCFRHGGNNLSSDATTDAGRLHDVTGSCRATKPESEVVFISLKDQIQRLEHHLIEKEVVSLQNKLNVSKVDLNRPSKSRTAGPLSSSTSPDKKPPSVLQQPKQSSKNTTITSGPFFTRDPSSNSPTQTEKSLPPVTRSPQLTKSEAQQQSTSAKSTINRQVSSVSRPSSAPLIPGPRPAASVVSTVQTAPLLSRSVSAAGRLGLDSTASAQSYVPQSYLNAMMGQTATGASLSGFTHPSLSPSSQAVTCSQSPPAFVSSTPVLLPQTSLNKDQTSVRAGFTFGSVTSEAMHSRNQWIDDCSQQEASSSQRYKSNLVNDIARLDISDESRAKHYSGKVPSSVPSRQVQGVTSDEFPHLDIINYLLDDEQNIGETTTGHHHHSLNRQYTFPFNVATDDVVGSSNGSCRFDLQDQYYDEGFNQFFSGLRDVHPSQVDLLAYTNGQIDGAIQNQWPFGGVDPSMLNMGNADANGYSYQLPEYSNLACGVNGYTMYRPSNGL